MAKSRRCTVSMGRLATLLCYILVKSRSLPVGRPTGSCPPPRGSPRSPAGRPSRCSPPAGPPPEGSQLCPVTRSRSPPPEPESWKKNNKNQREPSHVRVTKGRISGQFIRVCQCCCFLSAASIFHPATAFFSYEIFRPVRDLEACSVYSFNLKKKNIAWREGEVDKRNKNLWIISSNPTETNWLLDDTY